LLAAPALSPADAWAHATLLGTVPAAGTRVATAPGQLTLTFDQQVRPVAGGTRVTDATGAVVSAAPAHTSSGNVDALVIPLRPDLPVGDYTVHWQIVSTDGHLISGVYAIGIGAGRPPPQASSQDSPLDWWYLSARFVYFAGLLLLVGGVVYRVAVFGPAMSQTAGDARRLVALRERHRSNQLLALSAVLVLSGGWVALTLQGAEVAGVSFWAAFDHRGPVASALEATRFGRVFGRGIDVTAAFTILVALAYAAVPHGRRLTLALAVPAAAAGVWALAVPGISGHAGDPGRGLLVIALDAAHVAAAALWVGGLAQLVWVTPHATRGLPEGERDRIRTLAARRFSRLALPAVLVLSLTGGLRALWELSAVSQVWTTSYGRTLVAKTLLLVVLIGFGYRNRGMLDRFGSLRRSAIAELVVLTAVVAAVALLTNLPPGSVPSTASAAPSAPAGGTASFALGGGSQLSVWPGHAGANAFLLRLPAGEKSASLLVVDERGSQTSVDLGRVAAGLWAGTTPRLSPGQLTAQVAAGTRTWAATVPIGARQATPGIPVAPAATGPVAAGEAGDLAIGAQRVGGQTRFTVLNANGSSPRAAVVVVNGRVARPCPDTGSVCYQVADSSTRPLSITVLRAGVAPVTATLDLPAAGAAPAAGLVAESARALRALESVRIENDLASDPTHSVHTTFVAQSPDRLSIDVTGGTRSRIIGRHRWDYNAGSWVEQPIGRLAVPDPFWAPGAMAAYVSDRSATTIEVTEVLAQGPTFFRLAIDRRTHLVVELHMVTAAHFMQERYLDVNRAGPVLPPPPGAGSP
jgi:copper transport protein